MFTTSREVFQWMDRVCIRAIQPGLERMEWLLERLDHPQRRCKFIHIAGTNGKGNHYSTHIFCFFQDALM